MPKLRIYIETSVWSFAFADDAPDYRADTLAFFDRCRQNAFDVFVSDVVLGELVQADEPLRSELSALVRDIRPAFVALTSDANELADAFVREGVVPPSKPEDARHVAIAFGEELDVLVSWNFRHIASVRRAERFNAVAVMSGYYRPLKIVSPAEVLYDDAE
jgi:predicted nucleic acid-binding protein